MNLTHDQVKRLEDKEVIRYCKRQEEYVGSKTTENMMENFLSFTTTALGIVVRFKDVDALKNELKNDYIITRVLSTLSGGLTFLIRGKHVDFSRDKETHKHLSRDTDGYPLAGVDEVANAKQYPVISE